MLKNGFDKPIRRVLAKIRRYVADLEFAFLVLGIRVRLPFGAKRLVEVAVAFQIALIYLRSGFVRRIISREE
ncbi:hypothetical protein D9M71_772740 [compost metagenome]